jgi:curved DNA-binding protein CbpA
MTISKFSYVCKRGYATAKSPFEALNLPPNSSPSAIKKRYYELAKTLHPDTSTGDIEKFHEISQAYEILSHPSMRALYLRTGAGWKTPAPTSPTPGNRPPSYTNAYWYQDPSYTGGPWSSHDNTRFTSNTTFMSAVASIVVIMGIINVISFSTQHSAMLSAADRHHARSSQDLERARTEAQLFGRQKAMEKILDNRMKYWRSQNKSKLKDTAEDGSTS